jgi:gliding motility-associated-like protein
MKMRFTSLILFLVAISFNAFAQPANNNPCGAITLTPNTTCVFQQFTNAAATVTSNPSQPGCHNGSVGCSNGGDVWFVFTIASTDPYYINTAQVSGGMSDAVISVYAGNVCANPGGATLLACVDDGAAGSLFPDYVVSGQPIGTLIYIRVSHYRGGIWPICTGSAGAFNICVSQTMCGGVAMPGQSCQTATPICDLDGYCARTTGFTVNTWTQLSNAFCGSIENNSFLTFVAAGPTVNLTVNVSNCSNNDGIQFFVFSAATCGSGAVTNHLCNGQMAPGNNNLNITGLTANQTYYLMIDGFAGDVCTYTITVPNGSGILLPVTASNDTTICGGGNVTLSVSGGQGPYTWTDNFGNNLGTGASINVSPTVNTTYTVTGLAGNPLCPNSSSDQVTVTVGPALTISTTSTNPTTCGGNNGSILISGLLNNTTYTVNINSNSSSQTSNGSGQINITGLTIGTYNVSVTLNGCTSNTQVNTLTDPITLPVPTLTSSPSSTLCEGDNLTLTATGNSGATFNWTAPTNCGTASSNTYTVNNISTTCGGTYSVTQTELGCTSAAANITITVNPLPVISSCNTNANLCAGDTLVLSCLPAGGTYSITTGNSSISADTLFAAGSGTNTIQYTVTQNGCSNNTSFNITVNPIPAFTLNVNNPSTCNGTDGSIIINGLTANSSYNVNVNANVTTLNSNANGQITLSNLTQGSYSISISANGCSSTTQTAILNDPPIPNAPVINLIPNTTNLCVGDTIVLTAIGQSGATYTWTNPSGCGTITTNTTSINSITMNCSGSYTVTQTVAGCISPSSSVTLTVNQNPTINAGNDVTICKGASIQLNASSNATNIQWTPANTLSSSTILNPVSTPLSTTTYTVTATNAAGCKSTDQITISLYNLVADISCNPDNGKPPLSVAFANNSIGADSYLWNFGNGDSSVLVTPVYTYENSGEYDVTLIVKNNFGCIDTATCKVIVDVISSFMVPNIFSPNGDGINDVFKADGIGLSSVKAQIYNRWGALIYEWDDVNGKWDGKAKNGSASPDGVYFFIIEAKGLDGKEYFEKGHVTLQR